MGGMMERMPDRTRGHDARPGAALGRDASPVTVGGSRGVQKAAASGNDDDH